MENNIDLSMIERLTEPVQLIVYCMIVMAVIVCRYLSKKTESKYKHDIELHNLRFQCMLDEKSDKRDQEVQKIKDDVEMLRMEVDILLDRTTRTLREQISE